MSSVQDGLHIQHTHHRYIQCLQYQMVYTYKSHTIDTYTHDRYIQCLQCQTVYTYTSHHSVICMCTMSSESYCLHIQITRHRCIQCLQYQMVYTYKLHTRDMYNVFSTRWFTHTNDTPEIHTMSSVQDGLYIQITHHRYIRCLQYQMLYTYKSHTIDTYNVFSTRWFTPTNHTP